MHAKCCCVCSVCPRARYRGWFLSSRSPPPDRWSLSPGPSQTAGLYSGRMHHGAAGVPFLTSDIPSLGWEMIFTCTGDNRWFVCLKGQ
jgi:hypothetical protein